MHSIRREKFDIYQQDAPDLHEGIKNKHTRRNLIKAYILESDTFIGDDFYSEDLKFNDIELLLLEKDFWEVFSDGQHVGYIEKVDERFLIYYSREPSVVSDSTVIKIVNNISTVKQIDIPNLIFEEILTSLSEFKGNYYTSLKFKYDSLLDPEEHIGKASSIEINDRIGGLKKNLDKVVEVMPVFKSLTSIMLPSLSDKGGYVLYKDGKMTNRSNDFYRFRSKMYSFIDFYGKLSKCIEGKVRIDIESKQGFSPIILLLQGEDKFSKDQFGLLNESLFTNNIDPFCLYGGQSAESDRGSHLYLVDTKVWENLYMHLTKNKIILYIPKETSIRAIHRFICNFTMHIYPEAKVYIGKSSYNDLVKKYLEVFMSDSELF